VPPNVRPALGPPSLRTPTPSSPPLASSAPATLPSHAPKSGSPTATPLPPTGSVRPPPTDPAALAAELEHTKRVLSSKLLELRRFQTERETLLARIADRDARLREHEPGAELHRLRARITELEAERARYADFDAQLSGARASIRRIESLLADRDARIARLEQELSESMTWGPPQEDDLKQIKGIGPKYERALRDLGYRTTAQIAGFTEADVAKVAEKLRAQKSKIEKWIEIARALAEKR
jgi:predicted flap endonuclease-1-like 5' DNA nuclease